jgi:outer membrane receptor protein involved in Fe transport
MTQTRKYGFRRSKLALITALTLGSLPFSSVLAQQDTNADDEDVEQIIVTATKREQTLQEVPFSINAQSQEDIKRSGAQTLEELTRNVAGVSIQNLGPGQSQVAIRGVSAGQIVRDQPGVKEQVGIYLDESVISLSLFTPDLDFYDLNRVETLRGPQGTLFGSGSIGGTLRYITNQPEIGLFEGSAEVNLNTVTDGEAGGHAKAMVNVPLNDDTLALRAVVYRTEYAGFIDALREGGGVTEDVNGGNRTGGRVALKWQPNDDLVITPRLIFQTMDLDGFNRQEVFNLFANPFTTTRAPVQLGERQQFLQLEEAFEDDTLIADVTVNYALEDKDLTFIYSYTDREILVSRDASALTGSVSVDLGYPEEAVLIPSNLRDSTDVQQSTVEVRLASSTDEPLQWLVGGFYAKTDREYRQRLPTPGYDAFTDAVLGAGTAAATANGFGADSPYNADLPYELEQYSVFGELNYAVSDRLNLTLGSRFYDFEESRRFVSGGLFSNGDDQVDTTESDGVTSRLLANYELNDTVNINAGISQGFRLGGVNDPLNRTLCNAQDEALFGEFQDYDDETLTNYEIGFKAASRGWTANVAAFYNDIEDLQVTLDAGSCSSRISFNVEEAHSTGIEFELTRQATDNLFLAFSGSFIEAEFDSTVVGSDGEILGGVAEGNRLASVPRLQFSFASTYYFDEPLFEANDTYMSLSVQHVGNQFTQPGDQAIGAGSFTSGLPFGGATGAERNDLDLELGSFQTVNLNAGLTYDDWEVFLYANNIFDKNQNLSFDRERGGRARLGFRTNQPRTVGVTMRFLFE